MSSILSCFFPSTVVFVDDNESFLRGILEIVNINNISYKIITDSRKALDFVNNSLDNNFLDLANLTNVEEKVDSNDKSVFININKIHNEIYDVNRFAKISVIVADYSMPGINGVDFFSKIKNLSVQKILLTGVADEKIAIDAFNNGYINKFIKKGSLNFDEELINAIQKSVNQYFSIYTIDLLKHMSLMDCNHLRDPVFANFFYNTCLNRNYIEYYMLDTFGSYLFLTENGQPFLLSVTNENEMDKLIQIAIDSGDAQEEVLNSLKSREYMLVNYNQSGQLPPVIEWKKYLKPARRLEGYQTYFFNFSDSYNLNINIDKIKSYHDFRLLYYNDMW